MISSMDLFFSRDCVVGAGPAVELPRAEPVIVAPRPAAAVAVVAGCAADVLAVAVPDSPLKRSPVAGALVVAAPEVAGAACVVAGLENRLGAAPALVPGAPAPEAAGAGLEKRLLIGDADVVAGAGFVPPRPNRPPVGVAALVVAGCEAAG
jgi:hypothetical protein